jgi:hypothetical protein
MLIFNTRAVKGLGDEGKIFGLEKRESSKITVMTFAYYYIC